MTEFGRKDGTHRVNYLWGYLDASWIYCGMLHLYQWQDSLQTLILRMIFIGKIMQSTIGEAKINVIRKLLSWAYNIIGHNISMSKWPRGLYYVVDIKVIYSSSALPIVNCCKEPSKCCKSPLGRMLVCPKHFCCYWSLTAFWRTGTSSIYFWIQTLIQKCLTG